jgi:hypothetical protein
VSPADEALPEPSLSLLEYASLRAGLDLLPERAVDVANTFDLKDEAELSRELAAWESRLATRVLEARELPLMKARMRDYWVRFDRKRFDDVAPSEPLPPPPSAPPMPPPPVTLHAVPEPPPLVTPAPIARDAPANSFKANSFKKRLRLVRLVETVAAPDEQPAPKPLTVEGYALLCYASRHLTDRLHALFEAFGLVSPPLQEEADRTWKARLQADPIEHRRWHEHLERLRVLHQEIPYAERT